MAAVARIYAQGIEERVATFRTQALPEGDVALWLSAGERFPLLVHDGVDGIDGWTRVVAYSEHDFYAGVGEYMLYVDRDARRRGVGRTLLEAVCEEARRQGYWKLIGRLFTANRPSLELAARAGFREVGVHVRHGRLDGEWRDVVVVERLLAP